MTKKTRFDGRELYAVSIAMSVLRKPSLRCVAAVCIFSCFLLQFAPPLLAQSVAKVEEPSALHGVTPSEFEKTLLGDAEIAKKSLNQLGSFLESEHDTSSKQRVLDFLAEASRARAMRLQAAQGTWGEAQTNAFLTLAFIDPPRFFQGNSAFQAIVAEHLKHVLDESISIDTRIAVFNVVQQLPKLPLKDIEAVKVAWGLASRTSDSLKIAYRSGEWQATDDAESPILSTLFCFPSRFFDPLQATNVLRSISEKNPARKILVMSDQVDALRLAYDVTSITWVPVADHKLSPWLRDPLLAMRNKAGAFCFLTRPNLQQGREDDSSMVRWIASNTPESFVRSLGKMQWAESPVNFHGGNMLFTHDRVWLSVHSLQERVLQILGWKTIETERLSKPDILKQFEQAVETARNDVEMICGKKAYFVHPWPVPFELMESIAGGNDIDLDTVLTLLPQDNGITAMAGNLRMGRSHIERLSAEELSAFGQAFSMSESTDNLRKMLLLYQDSLRATALSRFLDLCTKHLEQMGISTVQTPLFLVPTELIAGRSKYAKEVPHKHFPIGFCNVVAHRNSQGERVAEGYSSFLPSLEETATALYQQIGYRLDLYPALAESIAFEGGYRCSTQEIRENPEP